MSACNKHSHSSRQVNINNTLHNKNNTEGNRKSSFWSLEVASPSAEECERFGQLVKLRLRDINGFVKLKRVLEAYKTGEINRFKVVDCVQVVFGHHRDLLEGFKMFLPRELHNHLMRVGEEQSEQSKLEIESAHNQDSDYFSESDSEKDIDQHEVEWSGDDDDEMMGPSRGGEMRPSPPLSVGPAEDEWGISDNRRAMEVRAQIPQSSVRERVNAASAGSNWGIVSDVLASNRVLVDVKPFDEGAAIVSNVQTTHVSSQDSATPDNRCLNQEYSPLIVESDFLAEPLAAQSTLDPETVLTARSSCLTVVHSMIDCVCSALERQKDVEFMQIDESQMKLTDNTIANIIHNTTKESIVESPSPLSTSPAQIIPSFPSTSSSSSSSVVCDGDEFLDYSTDSSAFSGGAQNDNYSDNFSDNYSECFSDSGGDHFASDAWGDTNDDNAEPRSVTETNILFDSDCSREVEHEDVESMVCTTENDLEAGIDGNSDDEVWRDGVLLQTKKGVTNSSNHSGSGGDSGEWSDVCNNDSIEYYSHSIREVVDGSIVDIYDNLSLNSSSSSGSSSSDYKNDSSESASMDDIDSRWCDLEEREGLCFPTSDRVTELDQDSEPLTTCNVSSTLSDDMSVGSSSVGDIQSVDSSEVNEEELEEEFKEVHEEVYEEVGCGEVELLAAQGLLSAINGTVSAGKEQDEEVSCSVDSIAQLEALLCSGVHNSSANVETDLTFSPAAHSRTLEEVMIENQDIDEQIATTVALEEEENLRRRTEPRLNAKSASSFSFTSMTATEPATLFDKTTATPTCGKVTHSKKGVDCKELTAVVCTSHRANITEVKKSNAANKRKVSEVAVGNDLGNADGRNTRSRGEL